ncbi:hypothetical protein [Photobacterium leiognathi]|uniref:hypothetical protein n=1 Tax=Photobacterium leiognathi TaxID=553611 RepID=UPI002982B071|nr:hypothetical protein [Photobacterium leiognathi]
MYFSETVTHSNLMREKIERLAEIELTIKSNGFYGLDNDELLMELVNIESVMRSTKNEYCECNQRRLITIALTLTLAALLIIGGCIHNSLVDALFSIGLLVSSAFLFSLSLETRLLGTELKEQKAKYDSGVQLLRLLKQRKLLKRVI